MLVTDDVSQPGTSWSKLYAPRNIWLISVTLDVSQPEMSWLKLYAPRNIWLISVTLDTFQSEILPLNDESENNPDMLVTDDVSQSVM